MDAKLRRLLGIGLGVYIIGVGIGIVLGLVTYQIMTAVLNQAVIGTGNGTDWQACTATATCQISGVNHTILTFIPTFLALTIMMLPIAAIYVTSQNMG